MSPIRISGIGAVCHGGGNISELWGGMERAAPAPSNVSDAEMDAPVRLIYLAAGSSNERDDLFSEHASSRAGAIAVRAALEAVEDAGPGPHDTTRVGVVIGSCMGASGENELAREREKGSGPRLFGIGSDVAAAVGANGPVVNVANACAAGAYAVGHAVDLLDTRECDRVIVAGGESYSRVALACFNQMSALDPTGCRPFTVDRRGTAFGEGAGALVLDRVAPGSAPLKGEVFLVGSGFTCDAGHATAPAADGAQARRALDTALLQAELPLDHVGLVVPHGTGTHLNDQVEAEMFDDMWPDASSAPPMYSAKALLGHTGGGAGALAAVVAVLCLRQGKVPANCDVGQLMEPMSRFIRSEPEPVSGVAVVNAYAFGGNNATLIFRRAS